jgi:gluconate 5-dehydrogenase
MSLELFKLDRRVALITGSSQGIGLALAKGLAGAGARVVLNGRDAQRLDKAADAMRAAGHDPGIAVFDVTDKDSVTKGVAQIEAEIGPVDILVNNAGIQRRMPLEDFPEEDWREVLSTNLDSVFLVSQAVGRGMIARKRGSIVNICSLMSELGRATIVPYTASKGAVRMFTRGLATEWGKHGVRVNGIGPGYFATEMNAALVNDAKFSGWVESRTPMARWGKVDELVGAAIYLASDAASFVTGHIIYVDGGMSVCV